MTTVLFPLLLQTETAQDVVLSQLCCGPSPCEHALWWLGEHGPPALGEGTWARCLWTDHESGPGFNGSVTRQWCQNCSAGIPLEGREESTHPLEWREESSPCQGQAPVPWQSEMLLTRVQAHVHCRPCVVHRLWAEAYESPWLFVC